MRVLKYYVENKTFLGRENNVNEKKNKIMHWYVKQIKNNKKLFSFISNLQTYYHLILDLQKVDQQIGDRWLIHGTNHRKNNQLQSLELPCRLS